MKVLAAILLPVLLVCSSHGISFTWNAADHADGYALYVAGTNLYRFDASTNLTINVPVPPGYWSASVRSYSTNNTGEVQVEAPMGNEVLFVMPGSTLVDVQIDHPFTVPVYALSSNANLRLTSFLQHSPNWAEDLPLIQYDIRATGTGTLFRTRMEIKPLP